MKRIRVDDLHKSWLNDAEYKNGFLKSHGILLPLSVGDVERDTETAIRFRS